MKRIIWQESYYLFRNILKDKRIINKLTQKELSLKLNKPQSFVSKYENGERNLDIIELIYICNAMNINIVSFMKELELKLKINNFR